MGLRESIETALVAAKVDPRDQPAADLALTYAGLIDNAAPASKYEKALRWLAQIDSEDAKASEHIDLITTALSMHSTVSDLGPKLMTALDDLLLSPRARRAATKAVTDDKPAANPLDQLADRRLRRSRPEDLDAAAEGPH